MLVCFAMAAAATSYLVLQQTAAAHRLASYNLAFDASQGAAEVMRVETTAARLSMGLPGASRGLLRLRFAILQNRITVLNRTEFTNFIAGHPEVADILPRLSVAVQQIAPLVERPDQTGALPSIVETLQPLEPSLVELMSLTANTVGDNIEAGESRLQWLHSISAAVTGILIVLGIVLIVILLRDNRLMAENYRRLSRMTDELQRTGSQLSSAHGAIAKANEELNAQNAVLRSRDQDLAVQNARFDAALNNMSQGLLMADGAGQVIVCNNRFLELFGLDWLDAPPGRNIGALFAQVAERGLVPPVVGRVLLDRVPGLTGQSEPIAFLAETEQQAIKVGHKPMLDGGWVATFEDITVQRRADAQTEHLAHHDTLTDLPNRLMFGQSLQTTLNHRAAGSFFALLLLDLDDFKDVNDTLGHIAGDTLLVAAAERLRRCIGPEDSVARLGGDEFAIIQTGPRGIAETEELARRIVATIAEPFYFEGQRVAAGASIGIALCTDNGMNDPESLLRSADMALYRAKAEGRSTWRFFAPEMEEVVRVRSAIASDLRSALDRQELELVYQPIFAFETGRLRQFEALMRWRHPTMGYVTPDRFIPVAEETRLILPMGEWVIGEACRTAMNWPEDVRIAVNLSPVQFRSLQLPRVVEAALARSGLAAQRLELEVTESALLQDGDDVRAMLRELRALGVTVALDDFGTGYASLGYLQKFPFDKIKIDRSFVSQIETRADSVAIVESVVRLGAKLGMMTTAEGIETREQFEILRSFGCDLAQGYLFDRPQSFATIQRKIAEGLYNPAAREGMGF
ncbi:putative bifunctional diguanylate cyclase/phosphodiesterase [Acidisoma cellulosilyticum]|uniref:putative bifunctional diguanylate cyclase/phosphodiesterase n=1 Tax=Acidisoma cellulosilyticum TaxID=2802395 RepID=UPI001D0A8B78|nr:EAL domain-containing protein [Acidisoma cellulosilyticum]